MEKLQNCLILFLEKKKLECETKHTHLGLTISDNLKWTDHIGDIAAKASNRVDLLSRLSCKLDRKTLDIMYKSFIRPVME